MYAHITYVCQQKLSFQMFYALLYVYTIFVYACMTSKDCLYQSYS